ncbi:hypothetical protein PPUN15366_11060 [Pseudomonas putida]|nr:hypothetical protein PPUN15366_11060 [Pseudomonas putida]
MNPRKQAKVQVFVAWKTLECGEDLAVVTLFYSACAGTFAGLPAPTGIACISDPVQYLWERASPRKGRHRQ